MSKGTTRRGFLSAALLAGAAPLGAAARNEAEIREFLDVPNAARVRMHWFIFGPAWTAEECERQLRLMANAHAGGVLIIPTYPIAVDDPQRGIHNQEYLSTEFFSVLNSALVTCKKLGLTADIEIGTGWPYGGPSVSLEDSAHTLRRTTISVTSAEPVELPARGDGEKLITVFQVDRGEAVRLAVDERGAVTPASAAGDVQIFYSAPARMKVKRASLGAEGWVVDHYNRDAVERYLAAVGDKLLAGVPAGSVRSIFCDSLEVFHANWTAEFPGIFERQRGYDLIPHLPALFDTKHPDSRDLRCDFWRTLSDLAFEAFIKPLGEWSQSKGVKSQVEAYGTPPVSLASYQAVDVPTGEHYEWKEFNTSRWASSGAHLAGKRTILAEAWTWLGDPNRFGDTLEQLKLCSDLHFLSGMNALYAVTYAYSPLAFGAPGWVPYFGPAVNHNSPSWPHFSHFADYVNRASYILQQGKPVADAALYLPAEDAMAEAPTGELLLNWAVRDRMSSNGPPPEFGLKNALHYESDVVKTIITNGYSLDGVDTFAFREMRVEEGRLRSGDGDYSILVLPNIVGVDVESLRKIAAFVNQGGVLIATRRLPERAYGLRNRENDCAEVSRLTSALFGHIPDTAALQPHRYGNGVAIFSRDERESFLNALRWRAADISFLRASEHVSFVHRRTADRDYYFLANTSEQPQKLDATFRVGAKQPEHWDLRNGTVEPLMVFEHTKAGTRVPFELGPLESRVIAFAPFNGNPLTTDTDLDVRPARGGWQARVFENRTFYIQRPRRAQEIAVSGIPAPIELQPKWRLRFEGADIQPVMLDELKSWTEIRAARFFSGRGVYETEFQFPTHMAKDIGVVIDLGGVRETAEIRLNGESAGVVWMRPYRTDISSLVRAGPNRLRVDVTNLLINRVLGMGPIDYSAVYARYGRRFPPGEEWEKVREPFPSGLLGPVRLEFYKTIYGSRATTNRRPSIKAAT
ncbi:MAG TPA: glycosyl hydrolase [Bryobacteraceae bacterium]|nr:glycosyl hydrolase [Bryobacteraceae bacterium]